MKKLTFFLLTMLLLGCQTVQEKRLEEIKIRMDQLMGMGKEDVVLEMGAPTELQTIESLEILIYHISYGITSTGGVIVNPYYPWMATDTRKTYEQHDLIRAYFKDGVMVKWDSSVVR